MSTFDYSIRPEIIATCLRCHGYFVNGEMVALTQDGNKLLHERCFINNVQHGIRLGIRQMFNWNPVAIQVEDIKEVSTKLDTLNQNIAKLPDKLDKLVDAMQKSTVAGLESKDKEVEVLEKLSNAIQKNTEAICEMKIQEDHVLNKLTAAIQEMYVKKLNMRLLHCVVRILMHVNSIIEGPKTTTKLLRASNRRLLPA